MFFFQISSSNTFLVYNNKSMKLMGKQVAVGAFVERPSSARYFPSNVPKCPKITSEWQLLPFGSATFYENVDYSMN